MPLIPLIQSLTSMVTVAVLNTQLIFDDLESGNSDNWEASAYVHDGGLLELITLNLFNVLELGPNPALPAAFAWASIAWRLLYYLKDLDEIRDRQLEAAQNERLSLPAPSRLEEAVIHLSRSDTNESPIFSTLAGICINQDVLSIMGTLLGISMTDFGSDIDRISRDRFRLLYLHVIRATLAAEGIDFTQAGLIELAHQILLGERNQQDWIARDAHITDPVVKFVRGDQAILRSKLLESADSYYPSEVQPLLMFSSALIRGEGSNDTRARSTYDELTQMRSVTQRLPEGFHEYRLEQEDLNENRVALEMDLPQFVKSHSAAFPNRRLLASNSNSVLQPFMVIEADTPGVVLDDSEQPYVARWLYRHSALEYFYHLLSTYVVGSTKVVYATQQPASTVEATRIIELFADILHSSLQSSKARGDGDIVPPDVLLALCIGSEHSPDTVSIVLSIFEEELLRQYQDPANESSLDLLVACTYFLQALIRVSPNRVWPWIARSRLLESDGNGGSLASILIGTEMVFGSYKFLIGCIRLFQGLVTNAVGGSVSRKSSSSNKALTRFNASSTFESGTSEKSMSTTLLTFGKMLASIYETSLGWKYNFPEDRLRINIGICEAFSGILGVAYEVDDAPDLGGKLSSIIAPIANYITDLYLTKSENDLPTNPILSSLISGSNLNKNTTLSSGAALSRKQTQSTLLLSELLVRIAVLLDRPWTHLEQQLYKATPLLARLYVTSEASKSRVVTLLETLVRGAVRLVEDQQEEGTSKKRDQKPAEPPSLLGHLGPKTAKNFMLVLSQLDEPLKIVDIQESVWNLLTAVVTCKQRWFALYLLTGSTPREMMRSKSKTPTQVSTSKSLLSRALDALSKLDLDMSNPPWRLWISMLEFITSAQNHWSWAMGDLREREAFIDQLITFFKWMSDQHPPVAENAITLRSYENQFASLATEILAMYLHDSRQRGGNDNSTFKKVLAGLTYLQTNGLNPPEYNAALHSSLRRNIETVFPGVRLSDFKHTTLHPQHYGPRFFYDTDFASLLLGHDRKWNGPRGGKGFLAELERANRNLSLVDSQIKLLQSWKLLALELSHCATKDPRITSCLIDVVHGCMKANADLSLPENLFGQLMVLRADLAFALLKRLVEEKVHSADARLLLGPVWIAIRAAVSDFDDVFSSDLVDYYRSLLRILYLTLHFYIISPSDAADPKESAFRSSFRGTIIQSKNNAEPPLNVSLQLLEILSDTVAKGFRSLATQLHADPASASPSDFALLTALLQRIISLPEMTTSQNQIALLFANSNTLRYATSLFSWSDRILLDTSGSGVQDDPLYGELALLFLVTLSSIKQLAETMAVESVLSHIASANLMNYFRRPSGMGPADKPYRLHSLWTKGILPLCLNLLLAVGAPIAAEISAFLNGFQAQLRRSGEAFNARAAHRITYNLAAETHSLALIDRIVEETRAAGAAWGVQPGEVQSLEWDRENVKEDLEGWVGRPGMVGLRERVVGDGTVEGEERVVEEVVGAAGVLGVGKGSAA